MSPRPIELPPGDLGDGVVRLRLMSDADVPAVTAACADPEIARFTMLPSPYAPRHAREWLVRARRGLASGTDLHTVVVAEGDGELLGAAGISGVHPASGRCTAGYWVAAKARGRGVATRALRLLCIHAFGRLDIQRIEAWIDPENLASLRVAERVGFSREGLLRSSMAVRGMRREMLMYSLLPDQPADRLRASGKLR